MKLGYSETFSPRKTLASYFLRVYQYYQRWYDPSVGRFNSVDAKPAELERPQGLDGFVYVDNNPVVTIDPSGEDPCTLWNPLTYGGCAKDLYDTTKKAAVVARQVVQPVVDKVCAIASLPCDAVRAEIAAFPQQLQQFEEYVVHNAIGMAHAYQNLAGEVNQAFKDAGKQLAEVGNSAVKLASRYHGCLAVAAWAGLSIATGGIASAGVETLAIGTDATIAAGETGVTLGGAQAAAFATGSIATAWTTLELFDVGHNAVECASELSS